MYDQNSMVDIDNTQNIKTFVYLNMINQDRELLFTL